jgi:hypothetical protein
VLLFQILKILLNDYYILRALDNHGGTNGKRKGSQTKATLDNDNFCVFLSLLMLK